MKELNDRKEMDFSGFIGNLKTREMEMNVQEEREPPKKKSIAFRVSPSMPEEEDSMNENEEEDSAMLIRRVDKIFYKKGRQSNFQRGRPQRGSCRRRRRWVIAIIARRRVILLQIAFLYKLPPLRKCTRRKRLW